MKRMSMFKEGGNAYYSVGKWRGDSIRITLPWNWSRLNLVWETKQWTYLFSNAGLQWGWRSNAMTRTDDSNDGKRPDRAMRSNGWREGMTAEVPSTKRSGQKGGSAAEAARDDKGSLRVRWGLNVHVFTMVTPIKGISIDCPDITLLWVSFLLSVVCTRTQARESKQREINADQASLNWHRRMNFNPHSLRLTSMTSQSNVKSERERKRHES